jgi:hypothetical protein
MALLPLPLLVRSIPSFAIEVVCAGVLGQSMGARNRVRIGLSYTGRRAKKAGGIDFLAP